MKRTIRILTLSGALMLPAAASAQQAAPAPAPRLSDAEKVYGLSLLWQEANYNFAFFDRIPDVSWDSVYVRSIPRVLATRDSWEYYRELQRVVAQLRDGHTNVSMPASLQGENRRRNATPWVATHRVEDRMLVRGVARSLLDSIPVHSEILDVDGRPAALAAERRLPYIAESTGHFRRDVAFREALNGPADSAVTIRFRTPSGRVRTATLPRDRWTRTDEWTPALNAPVPPFEMRWLEDGIAYVALNTMGDTMTVRGFLDALPELRKARALVLDVRRNGGGNSMVGYRVLQWLTNDTLTTARWRTREHRAAFKAWGNAAPQYVKYGAMDAWHDGGVDHLPPARGQRLVVPTAVLIDHATYSAAEDLLVTMDRMDHVTTVGRPSGGSTGNPLVVRLPGGGTALIVSKRDTYPDGREFVGVGVQPDVVVEPTVADLRAGRDVQLQRALRIVREKMRSR